MYIKLTFNNGFNQNISLFKEAIILYNKAAYLLRYPNHTAFRMEEKIAKKPTTVNAFLGLTYNLSWSQAAR